MAIYSIKDLEKLSGIKAHTIRIWEQRYGIINPNRTKTNIRYYTEENLKFLLNIAILRKTGIRIAKIAKMSLDEIAKKVCSISSVNFEHTTQLDALTISMIEMDDFKFNQIISTNIKQIGFERTMIEIITPFLDKLGVLWLTGSINPAQEHFISCLIRQKIIGAIDREEISNNPEGNKFLLFLPEGETQELSLLFLHYLLKARGNKVIYLGQNIQIEDLKPVYHIHKPNYVFTMISAAFHKKPVQQYIDRLAVEFPDSQILLSGYQVITQPIELKKHVHLLNNLTETIDFLNNISSRPSSV